MAKAKIILYTSKTLKNGESPLMLRITNGTARKYLSIGYSVKKTDWNFQTGKPKGRSRSANELTHIIERIELNALQKIQTINDKNKNFSLEEIITSIKNKNSHETMVFEYWESIMAKLDKAGKYGNLKTYKTTYSVFKKYRKNKDLSFEQLNYKLIINFEDYLSSKALKINSIVSHMKTIRALFNRAVNDDIVKKEYYPFEKYKIVFEKTVHRALSKEEVRKIKELPLDDIDLQIARDCFMFCFYARGMSFIDIAYLQVKNFQDDRFNYRRAKTGQVFTIKIIKEVKDIVTKYNDFSEAENFVFPFVQNEEMKYREYKKAMPKINNNLKKIGELINSSIPVTSYVARHSWGTIAKRSGISTSVISEGMGHATEKTTQIYLDSFDNVVIDNANDIITKLD